MPAEKDYAPGSEVSIKPATWRDLKGVYVLEKACFGEDAWPIWDVLGVLTFPDIVRLKAEEGDHLVGFIAGDERLVQNLAWIATFGVLPGYRRRGIGSRLLQACEESLHQPLIRLTVRVSNQAAIQLYLQHGYHQVGRWNKYYQKKEDALVFEKKLTAA